MPGFDHFDSVKQMVTIRNVAFNWDNPVESLDKMSVKACDPKKPREMASSPYHLPIRRLWLTLIDNFT